MKDNSKRKNNFTQNRAFGSFIILIGISILISSLIVNPWIGKFWKTDIIYFYYPMFEYFIWSLILGIIIIVIGFIIFKKGKKFIYNITILLITISLFLLFDRFLLVKFGKPIVIVHPETHYKYRPNTIRKWGNGHPYPDKIIKINKYGFHDDNFPIEKPPGEFRGITLGNSITMGFGLTHLETYSNQLEDFLKKFDTKYNSYQLINAGVQGYSVYQEYQILKESMKFEPDFVTIGFCMNDINSPVILSRLLGGKRIEEYEIMKTTNPLLSYLLNETGFGRLFIMMRRDIKLEESQKLRKDFDKKYKAWLIDLDDCNDVEKAWEYVLSDLENFYNFIEKNNLYCILLIFPDVYQFFNERFQKPQRLLKEHAEKYNIDVIDFANVFENLIRDNVNKISINENRELSIEEIKKIYDENLKKYFFDGQHPTSKGNRVIAAKLLEYLDKKEKIELIVTGGTNSE